MNRTIKVAIYQPEPEIVYACIEWLRKQPECEVRVFSTARDFFRTVLDEQFGYVPDIAVVNPWGASYENLHNIVEILNELRLHDFDITNEIDEDLFKEFGFEDWLMRGYYGIAVLAAMKRLNCPIRIAHTQYIKDGSLSGVLMYGGLVNGGVCPMEYASFVRRMKAALNDAQMRQAVTA